MNATAHLLYTIMALLIGIGLAFLWLRNFRRAQKADADRPKRLFADLMPLLDDSRIVTEEVAGSYSLHGNYMGRAFQIKVIADNLAARKLPSLWLMVTRAAPQPLNQTFDFMMRPAGPTTFSKFDFLPHALATPSDFPTHMVLRSDQAPESALFEPVRNVLPVFSENRGKELLITPHGLRLVTQLAEADRARYGVFRQMDFGEVVVTATVATPLLNALIQLEDALAEGGKAEEIN